MELVHKEVVWLDMVNVDLFGMDDAGGMIFFLLLLSSMKKRTSISVFGVKMEGKTHQCCVSVLK